jgi:hypothetical protein
MRLQNLQTSATTARNGARAHQRMQQSQQMLAWCDEKTKSNRPGQQASGNPDALKAAQQHAVRVRSSEPGNYAPKPLTTVAMLMDHSMMYSLSTEEGNQ